MLAITVAVRIDVYGVYYALVLGVLLLVPRRLLAPVWLVCLALHGVLLLAQYWFLLGLPPGFCFNRGTNQSRCRIGQPKVNPPPEDNNYY